MILNVAISNNAIDKMPEDKREEYIEKVVVCEIAEYFNRNIKRILENSTVITRTHEETIFKMEL